MELILRDDVDKLGRRPVMLAGWIMYALVYLAMAFVSAPWQFWALIVCPPSVALPVATNAVQ